MNKLKLLLFLVLSPFLLSFGNGDSINQDWYSKALENIKEQEYNIIYSEELGSYQSPNRANNLRFTYKTNGFTVNPRMTETYNINKDNIDEDNPNTKKEKIKVSNAWEAEFTILGYGRNSNIEKQFKGNNFIASENIAYISDENMKIDYVNNEDGMRQNFTIYTKPENEKGLLTLSLEVKTEKNLLVGANALVIKSEASQEYMKYNSLKIWDADGKELRGWFEDVENKLSDNKKRIQIVVNDKEANYPIIIDPLSSTENWTAESNQAGAQFAYSVSTAGDVNGDGYSDIIIGAYGYDNGEDNEGRAFVYYGSSTGLSTTADWTAEGNQVDAFFGYSVSTAGDVNGDGYSDIIIGAYFYDNGETNEGVAFVYHGSSTGLSSTADWNAQSNQGGAHLGYSVSTAGDVMAMVIVMLLLGLIGMIAEKLMKEEPLFIMALLRGYH